MAGQLKVQLAANTKSMLPTCHSAGKQIQDSPCCQNKIAAGLPNLPRSPNVNVASQLEATSGQLGLWILLSNYMVKLCSPDLVSYFRMIDNVMLYGSKKTLRLYTLDLDHSRVYVKPKLRGTKKKVYNRYKVRQMREAVKQESLD